MPPPPHHHPPAPARPGHRHPEIGHSPLTATIRLDPQRNPGRPTPEMLRDNQNCPPDRRAAPMHIAGPPRRAGRNSTARARCRRTPHGFGRGSGDQQGLRVVRTLATGPGDYSECSSATEVKLTPGPATPPSDRPKRTVARDSMATYAEAGVPRATAEATFAVTLGVTLVTADSVLSCAEAPSDPAPGRDGDLVSRSPTRSPRAPSGQECRQNPRETPDVVPHVPRSRGPSTRSVVEQPGR